MFGHLIGCTTEVGIKINICPLLPLKYQDLCKTSTVFMHELIVEPLVNAFTFRFFTKLHNSSGIDTTWSSLFSGAITSLYFTKLHELIPLNFKPQLIADYVELSEAFLGMTGNYIGEKLYEALPQSYNILANGVLVALFSIKLYEIIISPTSTQHDKSDSASNMQVPYDEYCLINGSCSDITD